MSKVVVLRCSEYNDELVYLTMKKGIDALGGIAKFVSPEERILVKPNFLWASQADKAIVTHPSVIEGMLRLLRENGCSSVTVGDSPSHGSSKNAMDAIGMDSEALYGAAPAAMNECVSVSFPEGQTAKEFDFVKEVTETDAIIGLCKMKTHMLERVTGAVKNMYGLICGHRKALGHTQYPNADIFARMLVDIHQCVKPRLHIMDGIYAMEGNGPASGSPVAMGVLLFSDDPVALDSVFCRLIDLEPTLVPTNVHGQAMGLGVYDYDQIEIVTDANGEMKQVSADELFKLCGKADFDVSRDNSSKFTALGALSKLSKRFSRRPFIEKDKCIKCGTCVKCCPVPGKAVDFKNGMKEYPVYDYDKCIRCYCCQEVCPQKAIRVKGR